jgi:transposase InsO family protein
MSEVMTAQLVTDALVMAISPRGKPDALVHHSDRGSPIYQRLVPAADDGSRCHMLDEPLWQPIGQCVDEAKLLVAQDRTHGAQNLSSEVRG